MILSELYEQYKNDSAAIDAEADKILSVSDQGMEAAMKAQPEIYRHWAQLAVIAQDEHMRKKDHVREVVWSDCYLRAAKLLEEEGTKQTEKRIEATAKRDGYYQRMLQELRDCEKLAATFKAVEQALQQKKEMLQSLNSRQCRELAY
jgi:hypothetical protein